MLRKSGFTLVELLIVITIIAILSAIGLASYTSFTKNTRDTKRRADLNFIQTALEQYFADSHFYPVAGSGNCPSDDDGLLRFDCPLTSPDGSKSYLSSVPKDMIPSNAVYSYVPSPVGCNNTSRICNSYCLFAQMENTGNAKADSKCPVSGAYNFSLTKP